MTKPPPNFDSELQRTQLRDLLDSYRLTPTGLAARAGLRESVVRNFLRGRVRSLSLPSVYRITAALDLPPDALAGALSAGHDQSAPDMDQMSLQTLRRIEATLAKLLEAQTETNALLRALVASVEDTGDDDDGEPAADDRYRSRRSA